MEIRVLKYFVTVAREENITRAAERLHVTQPTLSRQLHQLEEELGKKLFKRGNHDIKLTEDGHLLRKRAEEILDLVEKTESEMASDNDEIAGDIYIGEGETDAVRIIAKIVHQIQNEHPKVVFHNISCDSIDVIDKLNKGLIDFGILFEPSNYMDFEHIKFPVHDIWGVLMRKDSDLAKCKYIKSDMLKDRSLIMSRQMLKGINVAQWLGIPEDNIHIVATSNLIFNGSLLVDEGIGYAITLDKLINCTGRSHLCFRPLYPEKRAQMYLVWKKNQIFSKAAALFKEKFKYALGSHEFLK